jgi:hypothetical protein
MKNCVFWDIRPCGCCEKLKDPYGVISQKTAIFTKIFHYVIDDFAHLLNLGISFNPLQEELIIQYNKADLLRDKEFPTI